MRIHWRQSAIQSLLELDKWRSSVELEPIARYLKKTITIYFESQNLSIYTPGRNVLIKNLPVELRMVLISVGKSDPYKVFYRIVDKSIEIFLIRHPNQNTII